MPFSGNVETIPLDEVFQFVSTNSLDGTLVVAGGGAKLTLYFENAHMFFPFSAKRGTYSLGKILRQTGVLSREALEKHLESARKNRLAELRALEEQASPQQLEEARRKQYEEEIHDVFLWRRAYFEFTPGAIPEPIQVERSQSMGVLLDPTAFLMEVAHRADERRRIRRSIPSARVILVSTPGSEASILKDLAAKKIDVSTNPFDGTRSLEELVDAWGIPHHQSLATIAPLVERGKLVPLVLDRCRQSFESEVQKGSGRSAARYASHLIELEPPPTNPFAMGPEKELIASKAFAVQDEVVFTTRVPGTRAFTIVRDLVARGVPFTATFREDGREKRVALSESQLSVQASADDVTASVGRYLRRTNVLSEADLKAATAEATEKGMPLAAVLTTSGKLSEDEWLGGTLEKTIDEIAEVLLWRDVDLEVRNRARAFSGKGDLGGLALALPLTETRRKRLAEGLATWARTAEYVPGEDAVFGLGDKVQAGDPAARFFKRFDGRRTIVELRRIAKAEPLEFLRFIEAGVKRGYARAPTKDELLASLDEVQGREDDVLAYKLARAGVVFGLGAPFPERLAALRVQDAAPSPDSRPSIAGDMNGLSLAAVLQGLRGRKRTGTLSLSNGKRETRLFFHRGSVFLLKVEDASAEEFVNFFLEGGEEQLEFVNPSVSATGQVSESELDAADARRMKDEILDVLFWDEAKFSFSKNDLPNEFFEPGKNATKVALDTDLFLMEAIGRISEWDAVRAAIPSGAHRLAFTSTEAKFAAISELGMPELLTLIDGRKTFEDVMRISHQPRLDAGNALRALVESGQLNVLEPVAAAAPTSS
ncbi:MAG: DUF4388 domain-containing protein [Planctomycetota bacterium]